MMGIILAAGRGSRMGAMTADRPKCLAVLAGQTLLSWQMKALREAGVSEIVLVRGYAGDRLPATSCQAVDNPRWADTNMVASLCCAARYLAAGPCTVSYGDIVYHPSTVRNLIAADGDIVVAYDRLWSRLLQDRFDDPLEDAESFRIEGGRLVEIGAQVDDLTRVQGQYMGLLKITPDGWRAMESFIHNLPREERDRIDVTALLSQMLAVGAVVETSPVEGRWCEVDSASDLELYEKRLAQADQNGTPWDHDWRW